MDIKYLFNKESFRDARANIHLCTLQTVDIYSVLSLKERSPIN